MLNFWRDSKLAKAEGNTLVHPYNLGPVRNFQVAVVCIDSPGLQSKRFLLRVCAAFTASGCMHR